MSHTLKRLNTLGLSNLSSLDFGSYIAERKAVPFDYYCKSTSCCTVYSKVKKFFKRENAHREVTQKIIRARCFKLTSSERKDTCPDCGEPLFKVPNASKKE